MRVSLEIAKQEIESWLEYKKISEKKREANRDTIENLVDAISEGYLVLESETKELVHTLKFPTEGDQPIKELKYAPRLNGNKLNPYMVGVKTSDTDERVRGYIAALTSTSRGLVRALDSEDLSIAQSIAIFFI
jgi:hypothetical protein